MNITVEPINACRKRLKIEVPLPRVQEKLTSITHQFQKIAKVPGFRVGHVPTDIIQKRFQADIESELKEELVEEACNFALKEKKITPVTLPKVEDLNYTPDTTFSLSIVVDCEPEIPLPQYKKLKLTRHDNTIPEEEIEKNIRSLLAQDATYHDINDRPLALGDYAVLDYQATLNNQPLEELHPETKQIAKRKNFWIHIQNDSFSIFPGFIQECIGLEINQSRTFTIKLPDDFEYPPLAGQSLQFSVTLIAIKKQELPPLDDTFAQKWKHNSVEEFRSAICTYLQKTRDHDISQLSKKEIINILLSSTQFDLPKSLLEEEIRNIHDEIVEENKARGIPIATIEENQDRILAHAQEIAKNNVKARILINKIAKAEGIEPTQEELYNRILMLADRYKIPPKKFINQIQKNRSLSEIFNQITIEKTLDFILSQAIYE